MSVKRAIRKRSFLLFELLISLALIALCVFPLIKPHAFMRKSDRKQLEEIQLQRISQEAFCLLKKEIYEHKKHPWEELKQVSGELHTQFSNRMGKIYTCSYTIYKMDDCTKKLSLNNAMVLEVKLDLKSSETEALHFLRTLYVERRDK